jgi:MYXO-CTERM domain-containing protein
VKTRWLTVSFVAVFAAGCGGDDNCNEPLFTSPTSEGIREESGVYEATVTWPRDPDDVLPDEYYEQLGVTDFEGEARAVGAGLREVVLDFGSSEPMGPQELVIHLDLPDNQGYAECSHPGMSDHYFVDLTVSFDDLAYTGGEFAEVTASRGACSYAPGDHSASWGAFAALLGLASLFRRRLTTP